ncbi:MAG: alpha/beta fold hydrolase [Ilumatobacteraceae bacterium]
MHRSRRRISWSAPAGASHDGALHARTLGAGAQGVLLLHGLGGSNAYWGAAYDTVAGAGRLVVPDLLGFGRSPRPASGYTATDHVEALTVLLAELGVTGPVVVAAHSFGCLVALALAEQHPDLVAGVVAFCPPLYPDEAAARTRVGSLGWLEHQLVSGGPWAQITCQWSCKHRRAAAVVASLIRPGWPAVIRRDGLQHSWTSYSQSFHEVLATAEAAQRLANIDVPVEFVAGSDDPVTDLTHLRHLAAHLSHVTLTIRDGADHDLPLTDPSFAVAIISHTAGLLGGPPGSG